MKIYCNALLHFDGTTMAIEIQSLFNNNTSEVFRGHTDAGAKVIEFLRAKGLDVYDRRQEEAAVYAVPPSRIPDEMFAPGGDPVYPRPDPGTTNIPIFSKDFDRDHVKRDQGHVTPKTKPMTPEEIESAAKPKPGIVL